MPRAPAHGAILTPYAKKLVRFNACQLSRSPGFHPSEREDLEQSLWLAILERADKFDSARASINTFVHHVVTSTARMLFRRRHAPKQSVSAGAQSLDHAPCMGSRHSKPLARVIHPAHLARRLGTAPPDELLQRENAEAVAHALSAMPQRLRAVCRQLTVGSVSGAARAMRTSRRQIRRRVAAARPFFIEAGFFEV